MAGRKSHTEEGWTHQPEHEIRCVGTLRTGTRCRKVAEPGSNVCNLHGGRAPQVQKAAAERMLHSAPAAAELLVGAMNDPNVPWGVRVKIMQDVLDRSGLAAAQVHKIMPIAEDPVEALFKALLEDPNGLVEPAPAIQSSEPVVDHAQEAVDRLEESWSPDAEVRPLKPQDFGKVGPHAMRSASPPRHIREGLGL